MILSERDINFEERYETYLWAMVILGGQVVQMYQCSPLLTIPCLILGMEPTVFNIRDLLQHNPSNIYFSDEFLISQSYEPESKNMYICLKSYKLTMI